MLLPTILTGVLALAPGDAVEVLLDEDLTAAVAAREISSMRPFPVQELFWILQGEEIPAAWTPDGKFDYFLTSKQRSTIQFAFAAGPHGVTAEYLKGLAGTERGVETKATIVEVLGWMGRVSDLSTLLLAAAPESEKYLAPGKLRVAFGGALAEMLERHQTRLEPELPWAFRNAHSGLRMEVVKLVENEDVSQPLDLLSGMLGIHLDMNVFVLQTMHIVGLRPEESASEATLRTVRPFLQDHDPACVRLACRTLGALEDVESISLMIQLLDTEDRNLREAAAYGLSVGTGLHFEENVLRWRSWFERERAWWDEHAHARFDELANADIETAMKALVDVSERSLDRWALAEGVAPALRRSDRGLVLTASAYLARLGSKACVPELVELLDREDESIREAAWRALMRITGKRLGPDPSLWIGVSRSIER